MKKAAWFPLLLMTAAVLAPGCTNKQGETESPVTIVVNLPDQAGLTNIDPARTLTIPSMVLTSNLKNPTQTNPQGFADVLLGTYTVRYYRKDGGTRVPDLQTFAAGNVLPSPGTVTLTDFPVLSQTAMQQSPFDQLLPFNGGFDRETGSNEIRLFYDVTFFGQTVAGQRVQSETVTGIRIFVFQ